MLNYKWKAVIAPVDLQTNVEKGKAEGNTVSPFCRWSIQAVRDKVTHPGLHRECDVSSES